jgi:hypothetical protein
MRPFPGRALDGYSDEIGNPQGADCAGINKRKAYPTGYLGRVCFSSPRLLVKCQLGAGLGGLALCNLDLAL